MGIRTRQACLAALARPWSLPLTPEPERTAFPTGPLGTQPPSPLHPHVPPGLAHLPTQPHAHLHQKLIAWDPLYRLDHEVGECLLFLVFTHALLKFKTGQQGSRVRKDMQRSEYPGTGSQEAPAQPEGRG